MSNFEYLFNPIKIGSMEVPNRIVMAPHALIGWEVGSDEHVGYFEERAKGGAGMLIIASCLTHYHPAEDIGMLFEIHDDRDVPKIKRIVDAVHKHGSKAIVQPVWLCSYPGMKTPSKQIPYKLEGICQGRSLTIEDIQQLVKSHGQAAYNAKLAGADGVEMPLGGGDGLQHFLSVLANKRTDEYGGSLENRGRILVEIAQEIKDRCGADFNVGYCINVDDSPLGGEGLEVGVQAAKMLADTGNVDWLRVIGGAQKPQHFQLFYPTSYLPQGTHLYAAAAVREVVDNIPIISGGRINSAEFAEQAIAEGQCDMVFAARAFICDPAWPNKAKEGRFEDIRSCIGDMEGCFMRMKSGGSCGCTYNPYLKSEHLSIEPAAKPKKVVVVGGGPAGLQTALTAAQRGHKVTLLEERSELGGHTLVESRLPGLGDRGELARYLGNQLEKLGVDVRLSIKATAEDVVRLRPDAVVVATGSAYSRDCLNYMGMMPIKGLDTVQVLTPEDILCDGKEPGDRVLVYEGNGYLVGPGIAEMLADQGRDVTLVTIDSVMAKDLMPIGLHQIVAMRVLPKAEYIPDHSIIGVDDGKVTLMSLMTYEEREIEDVDTIVAVGSRPPVDELYDELVGKVPELHIVGDANDSHWSIFGNDDAVKAGHGLGLQL